MNRFAALLILLSTGVVHGQKPSSQSAGYPVTVHVIYSRSIISRAVPDVPYQQLETVINGQQVELSGGGGGRGILALGDYPARRSSRTYAPKNPPDYDLYQVYDLLMPDGQVRAFQVTGLGPSVGP